MLGENLFEIEQQKERISMNHFRQNKNKGFKREERKIIFMKCCYMISDCFIECNIKIEL